MTVTLREFFDELTWPARSGSTLIALITFVLLFAPAAELSRKR